MTLPSPRAVIFDWDNTLVDTWPIIHEAINATFAKWQFPIWTLDETKARVRKSMRDSFPEIFGGEWQKAGEFYQQQYRSLHLEKLKPLPGAAKVIKYVKERGLFSAVVSNKKAVNLRQEVEHLGWQPLFNVVVGSDDAPQDKPHADPVILAFEKSPIKPGSDVWFIGDSDIDLECANTTGCTAILYGESARHHLKYTTTHFHGFPYRAHVHTHKELLVILSEAEVF
ncbi:MAG: HAD family hydrolase [Pseudomonadota bacterium]|nr:HAD family hydrolase [Pseudomonadota bacterium]MDE3037804.1 HAD family hydrolase [Pseudomonadota bacterium]